MSARELHSPEALLLDEHFPPALAELMRQSGYDVVGVVEAPSMRGISDAEVYQAAIAQRRRVVTENVRDFRPLLVAAINTGAPAAPLLLTTARRHPRSDIGSLAATLGTWLERTDPPKQVEEWL